MESMIDLGSIDWPLAIYLFRGIFILIAAGFSPTINARVSALITYREIKKSLAENRTPGVNVMNTFTTVIYALQS
jgi:hypothetical protein